jgi:hypothetical protein
MKIFILIFLIIQSLLSVALAQTFSDRLAEQVKNLRQKKFAEINAEIQFVSMQSQVDFFKTYPSLGAGILTKKDFVISYNDKFDKPDFKISDSALSGVLAHELSHVLDFQRRSYFHLLELGVFYLFFSDGEKVKSYERKTDMWAVCKGLGNELSDFRLWLYAQLDEKNIELKKQMYLTPEEIRTFDPKHCDQLTAL